MKINSVVLTNIGPYSGTQEFSFATSKQSNIVLIGGKNGSGKTTLLQSLRIGLLGALSYGFVNNNATYYKHVRDLVSRNKSDDELSSIFMELELAYKNNIVLAQLTRTWNCSQDKLEETISVYLDGSLLTQKETFEFQSYLYIALPPMLLDAFTFDGESIGKVIENDQIQLLLRNSFDSIFGTSYIYQMQSDLQEYILSNQFSNGYSDEIKLLQTLNEIKITRHSIKSYESELNILEGYVKECAFESNQLFSEYRSRGGISKSEHLELLNELDNRKRMLNEYDKDLIRFLENDAPIIIASKLLESALKKANKEKIYSYNNLIIEMKEAIRDYNFDELIRLTTFNNKKMKPIHMFRQKELATIKEVLKNAKKNYELIRNKHSYIRDIEEQMTMLSAINSVDQNNDLLKTLLSKIDEINNRRNHSELKIDELKNNIGLLKVKLHDLSEQLEMLNSKKNAVYGKDNSINLASIAIQISDEFSKEYTISKLADVEMVATSIFVQTIQKKNYIRSIKIDQDFRITILSEDNQIINYKAFSAGEKQLLVSSIIWAIIKSSDRDGFFIFDTPLARLDSENRASFIKNIVQSISNQVIILSTDSEFVGEYYDLILNRVSKQYLLSFDDTLNTTKITEGYFES